MRSFTILAPLLVIGAATPLPVHAQTPPGATPGLLMVQPLPGTTDADRLADAVRRVGAAPRDLPALLDAGELSFKVGDVTAAQAFFKRAEEVDPGNARVKAGIARILVNGEHPGEALRYFDQAIRGGLPVSAIAADRGLAYDLIGEQERAQRDYRLALRDPRVDVDETQRRYALSLGIAGRKDEALTQIDALLRRSDRGAWRARAFILAMSGDQAGAERIATNMMPPGMATGLAPFFARLATLRAADRAYAVHFGELGATPARVADARLVPALSALGPDSYAPVVQLAAAAPAKKDRKRDRKRDRQVALAATTVPARVLPPPLAPAATPPTAAAQPPLPRPAPSLASTPVVVQPSSAPPVTLSAAVPPPASAPVSARPASPALVAANPAALPSTGAASAASVTPTPLGPTAPVSLAAASSPVPEGVAAPTRAPLVVASDSAPAQPAPTVSPAPAPIQVAAASAPTPPAQSENRILARIVGGDAAPAAQPTSLSSAPAAQPVSTSSAPSGSSTATVSTEGAATRAERAAAEAAFERQARRAAARKATEEKRAAAKKIEDAKPLAASTDKKATKGKTLASTEADDRKSSTRKGKPAGAAVDADQKGTGKKAKLADDDEPKGKKAKNGTKLADDDAPEGKKGKTRTKLADNDPPKGKKGADAKDTAKKAESKSDAPAGTIWVQVAGGANEEDLHKAWSAAQAKAPALAGRKGYSTPLRATNRVVTGPFKTEAEAQALVNTLTRQGVQAFTFTGGKGQKLAPVKKPAAKK